jgi:hypothetical protein
MDIRPFGKVGINAVMNNAALCPWSALFFSNKPSSYNSWVQPKEIFVVHKTLPDVKISADQAVKLIRKVCFEDFIVLIIPPCFLMNSFTVKLLFSETARRPSKNTESGQLARTSFLFIKIPR